LLQQLPQHEDGWLELANNAGEVGDDALREQAYRKVIELNPTQLLAYTGLGVLEEERGRQAEARAAFARAVELDPLDMGALFHDVQSRTVRPDDGTLEALQAARDAHPKMQAGKLTFFHYAKAKALDDLGASEQAFAEYLAGAASKRQTIDYHAERDDRLTQRLIEVFDASFIDELRGAGDPAEQPVFILGMPRSGTTLTEQIVASHPQVHGAGELTLLLDVIGSGASDPFPDSVRGLSRDRAARMGAAYAQRLRDAAPDALRITDKMPANYLAVGLIHVLLPNAKIIHVQRDPVDTCLSCFTRLFATGQEWSYDLVELGRHYVNYTKIMNHWREVLPSDAFLEVRYEDVVGNLESEARRIVAYCGLEWDEACLAFHQNKRSVRTASVRQVRQPIYRTSIARWRKYEAQLQPLLQVLGELTPRS
jgi:tetratricopeptide (TPR) repeat protein